MATATVDSRNHISDTASGSFTGDGAATTITIGFSPTRMKVVNATDTIIWEKTKDMATNASIKITGTPTVAIDTTSAILFNSDNKTVTLSAALGASGKAISWVAER
jgi:hypothetical protein